jgi:hypothetical protein
LNPPASSFQVRSRSLKRRIVNHLSVDDASSITCGLLLEAPVRYAQAAQAIGAHGESARADGGLDS